MIQNSSKIHPLRYKNHHFWYTFAESGSASGRCGWHLSGRTSTCVWYRRSEIHRHLRSMGERDLSIAGMYIRTARRLFWSTQPHRCSEIYRCIFSILDDEFCINNDEFLYHFNDGFLKWWILETDLQAEARGGSGFGLGAVMYFNDELCIKSDEFCISIDGFCRWAEKYMQLRPLDWEKSVAAHVREWRLQGPNLGEFLHIITP